jgi:hypothetical protein
MQANEYFQNYLFGTYAFLTLTRDRRVGPGPGRVRVQKISIDRVRVRKSLIGRVRVQIF